MNNTKLHQIVKLDINNKISIRRKMSSKKMTGDINLQRRIKPASLNKYKKIQNQKREGKMFKWIQSRLKLILKIIRTRMRRLEGNHYVRSLK